MAGFAAGLDSSGSSEVPTRDTTACLGRVRRGSSAVSTKPANPNATATTPSQNTFDTIESTSVNVSLPCSGDNTSG